MISFCKVVSLGVHAHEGYGSWRVCVCVCVEGLSVNNGSVNLLLTFVAHIMASVDCCHSLQYYCIICNFLFQQQSFGRLMVGYMLYTYLEYESVYASLQKLHGYLRMVISVAHLFSQCLVLNMQMHKECAICVPRRD